MSRSYKKTPILKSCPRSGKWGKKFANDTVRKAKDVGDYGSYKKLYPQWNIHDYIDYWPLSYSKNRHRSECIGCDGTPGRWYRHWRCNNCWKFDPKAAFNSWAKYYLRK